MQRISNSSPSLLSINARRLMKYSLLAAAFATTSMAQDLFLANEGDAQVANGKIPVQPEERRDEAMIGENEVTVSSRSRRSLEASPDCVYETDPTSPEITIHFMPGEVVKLEDQFKKAFNYYHGTLNGVVDEENCPVTHIFEYASPAGMTEIA